MHCVNCGTEQPNGALFCPGCGRSSASPSSRSGGTSASDVLKIFVGVILLGGTLVLFIGIGAFVMQQRVESGKPLLPTNQVIINFHDVLKDGQSVSWRLPDGTYRVEMTASDGCTVEWLGGNCPATQPMTQLTTQCELTSQGQLVVRNPTTFGLGPAASVTVKVTRIAF